MSQPALQFYQDSWQQARSDSRTKLWSATIEGQLHSKANSRKLMEVPVKGARRVFIGDEKRWTKSRPLFVKSDAAKAYEDSFRAQIKRPAKRSRVIWCL